MPPLFSLLRNCACFIIDFGDALKERESIIRNERSSLDKIKVESLLNYLKELPKAEKIIFAKKHASWFINGSTSVMGWNKTDILNIVEQLKENKVEDVRMLPFGRAAKELWDSQRMLYSLNLQINCTEFLEKFHKSMERNIWTIKEIKLDLNLRKEDVKKGKDIVEEFKKVIELLKNRGEMIHKTAKNMDGKLEKVWKIPWALGQIIHGYTWERQDLQYLSKKPGEIWKEPAEKICLKI